MATHTFRDFNTAGSRPSCSRVSGARSRRSSRARARSSLSEEVGSATEEEPAAAPDGALSDRPTPGVSKCSCWISSESINGLRRSTSPPCHLQRAMDRIDHFKIQNDVWIRRPHPIVEKFANHRSVTKDSASYGHRDSRKSSGPLPRKKPAQDDPGKLCQFARCFCDDLSSHSVPSSRRSQHCRKQN